MPFLSNPKIDRGCVIRNLLTTYVIMRNEILTPTFSEELLHDSYLFFYDRGGEEDGEKAWELLLTIK